MPHGSWPQAFGYAIDAGGRKIVISGDTAPSDAILEACKECDVLVHEVYSADRFSRVFGPVRGKYHASFHTSTTQLAEIATKTKPKLLVLYHASISLRPRVNPNFPGAAANSSPEELLAEVQSRYGGKVVVARDLDVY